ncbi:MAG: hypothetical protein KBT03_09870 [Bacteroidales bacterium]|nr:hypothetical protein [Candidatus Scybalousia scybalohippi]
MAEMEKVYCVEKDNSALTAALMNRGSERGDLVELLLILMFGGGYGYGFGRNGFGGGYNGEIESLRNQIADNKNTSDLMTYLNGHNDVLLSLANNTNSNVNAVRDGICTINAVLGQMSEKFGTTKEAIANQVIMGNKDIMAMFSQCCCEQKLLIQQMGYEGQLRDQANHSAIMQRIEQLANGITQGFSATAYEAQKNATAIMANSDKNTQRILDQMCADKAQALRDLLAEKDRELLLYKMKDCN